MEEAFAFGVVLGLFLPVASLAEIRAQEKEVGYTQKVKKLQ
jgi:hypothetical protein